MRKIEDRFVPLISGHYEGSFTIKGLSIWANVLDPIKFNQSGIGITHKESS
jgi:hypothetical protein